MSLHQHLTLLNRVERTLALKALIEQEVRPGARVLDAGTGSGLLAVFAARAGAKQVVAVDNADLSVARELARANGCSDRIEFVQADLRDLVIPDHERFDLVIALIYFNDLRRDEAQSRLAQSLLGKYLAEAGRAIPSRVRYSAYACEWPAQDFFSRRQELDAQLRRLEGYYGVDLGALREGASAEPDARLFPSRLASGEIDKRGARLLGPSTPGFVVDYGAGPHALPDELELEVHTAGLLNAVVFIQELLFEDKLIFSNECLTWIRNPAPVAAGARPRLLLDDEWRASNAARLMAPPASPTRSP